jgi:hypothetical protein
MASTATERAAEANKAAKAKVQDQSCPTCPKKKCDAEFPKDENTKKVALTIYAEATADPNDITAVGSVIHNRVGKPSPFGVPKDASEVVSQPKQFSGYNSPKYKRGENKDNLNAAECKNLKDAIETAEKLKKDGVPAEYKKYNFFHAAKNAPAGGTPIGGNHFYTKWWGK